MSTDSPPPDGGSPGSHRAAASTVSTIRLAFLGVITALVLVLVGVGVIGWLRPQHNEAAIPTASSHTSTSRSASTSGSSASPSHSRSKPSPSKSSKSSSKPTPTKSSSKPATKPTKSATPTPTPKPTHSRRPATQVPRDYPVVVLNETPITGLAAQVAKELRHDGWTVTGVGNWIGEISTTTVYYPKGQYTRAERLAADLGVWRIRPRVGGMLTNRLTVVLHDRPR